MTIKKHIEPIPGLAKTILLLIDQAQHFLQDNDSTAELTRLLQGSLMRIVAYGLSCIHLGGYDLTLLK